MNVDLERSEIHTLIAACRDRRDRITRGYDGANAGTLAVELGTLDRAERKLRDAIAPVEDPAGEGSYDGSDE